MGFLLKESIYATLGAFWEGHPEPGGPFSRHFLPHSTKVGEKVGTLLPHWVTPRVVDLTLVVPFSILSPLGARIATRSSIVHSDGTELAVYDFRRTIGSSVRIARGGIGTTSQNYLKRYTLGEY